MRAKSVIKSIGILLLAIAVGVGITWMIYDRSQDDDAALLSAVDGDASSIIVPRDQTAADPLPVDGVGGVAAIPPTAKVGNELDSSDQDAEPTGDPLWNSRIRSALTSSDLSVRQKSQQLLELAAAGDNPSATVDQRLEALDHGLNLVDDADYAEDALRLALRSDLPAELGESILTDLHGRDPELLIGTCQKIAALTDHPLREEAQEIVNFLGAEAN